MMQVVKNAWENRRIGTSEMSILENLGGILPYNLEYNKMRIDLVAKTVFLERNQFFWVWLKTIKSYTLRVSNYPVSLGK